MRRFAIAVDIGGTFTDAVCIGEDGETRTSKVLSTPPLLADGVLKAIEELAVPLQAVTRFVHGTTAGLNTFLERRGARVALVTTRGFRDVYEIGRASRPDMYNLRYRTPAMLLRRRDIFEIDERISAEGDVLVRLDESSVLTLLEGPLRSYESIAVCFIHAYRNPVHEEQFERLAASVASQTVVVSSHNVAPEWREYERTSTTVMSAYIAPALASYLGNLGSRLAEKGLTAPVTVMQSNGGITSIEHALRRPVQTLFSGPVGGNIAGTAVAQQLDLSRLICIDMGGTSFDVSLVVDGVAAVENQIELQGHPILSASVAIHTIGAGGGSIAHAVAGGLRVGPRSAGARPGPAAYGLGGGEPTVTDANLVLGRLPSATVLVEGLTLAKGAAVRAIESLAEILDGESLGLSTGIVTIAANTMANAIKEITVKRGIDPREFGIVAFGGAGPLHACAIAEELGIRTVVIPSNAGVLSAWGMLQADVRHDLVRSHVVRLDRAEALSIAGIMDDLRDRGARLLVRDAVSSDAMRFEPAADLRYTGQEYTVAVAFSWEDMSALIARLQFLFEKEHLQLYGHNNPHEAIELVNVRMTAIGRVGRHAYNAPRAESRVAADAYENAYFGAEAVSLPVYRRRRIGQVELRGPAIVLDEGSTILIPPGWRARSVRWGHLVLDWVGAP